MKNLFYVFCVSFLKKQLANNIFAFLTLLFLLLPQQSCNTTEPPPFKEEPPKAIKLKLLDVSCTEAFINVNADDSVLPVNITLKKDNVSLFSFTLTKIDTVVIDTTLQPNITYTYQTTAQIKGKEENSDTIQVKTLNTTSHNFTWQKFEFGGIGGSSVLYDVAIIDENNIWAVGEIYADTTGQAYNAVHWNGSKWELKRIYFPTVCGSSDLTPYPAKAIFAFEEGKILISSSGDKIAIVENGIQVDKFCLPSNVSMSINKIWGSSSNDLYVVGNAGSIAHYKNGSWSKIESGTDANILDIWSDKNPFTNLSEIICTVGRGLDQAGPWSGIIRIKDNFSTESLDQTGLGQIYGSLWFKSGIKYYIVGDGLYVKTYNDTTKWVNLNRNITSYYMSCIRGNGLNDIIVSGAYGELLHNNGSTWKSFRDQTSLSNGTYYRVAIKGNIVVAVGQDQNQGIILLGHR